MPNVCSFYIVNMQNSAKIKKDVGIYLFKQIIQWLNGEGSGCSAKYELNGLINNFLFNVYNLYV